MADEEAVDQKRDEDRTWIAWTRGPPIIIKRTWLFKGVITALMKRAGGVSRPSDRDSRGAIQGVYNASHQTSS